MNPHAEPAVGPAAYVLGGALVLAGLALLASARRALRWARKRDVMAVRGPYSFVRHPQYVALLVIILGFLLQWPSPATLLMFPVLAWSYVRLARDEERWAAEEFGCAWRAYIYGRPAFLPRLSRVWAALASPRLQRQARLVWQRFTTGARVPATRGRTS